MKFELTLKHLSLENFRLFDKLEVPFHHKLTVLIGENGAGKTALLEAVAKALNVYVSKLRSKGAIDFDFSTLLNENDIKYNEKQLNLAIELFFEREDWESPLQEEYTYEQLNELMRNEKDDDKYQEWNDRIEHFGEEEDFEYGNGLHWEINKTRSDEKIELLMPKLNVLDQISIDIDKKKQAQDISIPIVVYYGCNRTNTATHYSDKANYTFEPYNTYDFSLEDKSLNFDKFVKFYDWRDRNKDISLIQTLKTAILTLMNDDFTDIILNTERFGDPQIMLVSKGGSLVSAAYLSAGQKSLLLLVSDIALRLWLANKYGRGENPLHGQGIVLIDEIDLHLHPKWQAVVVEKLQAIFPNVQWVMTTHSPFVLQDVSRDSVLILNNGQLRRPEATLGQDINTILTQTMKTKTEENESSMQEIFELIALNDIETAKEKILAFESSKLFEGKLLRLEGAKTVIKRKEILAQ